MDISAGFRLGQYEVRPEENTISGPAGETRVEPKCMDVLVQLAEADGRTISRDQIVSAVWPRGFVSDDVLTRCISQIRKALGDDAKSPQYLLTVRKRGYKLAMPVAELASDATEGDNAAATSGSKSVRAPVRYRNYLVVALLTLALGYVLWDSFFQTDKRVSGDKVTVAVMPFKDLSSSKDQAWFATGMTGEIRNILVQVPGVDVVGRPTAAAFDSTQQSLAEFAAGVGFTHAIDGSIGTDDNGVRISAQLTRISDGVRIWSETFDAQLTDVVSVQNKISNAVIGELTGNTVISISPSSLPDSEQQTDFSAYRLYLKGRYHLSLRTAQNLEQAIQFFEYALQVDAKSSRTHSALATVYAFMPYYSSTRSPAETILLAGQHAELALRLDEQNAEAHAVSGLLAMTHKRDWLAAANAFERALVLAPGSADIANLYGDFFYAIGDYDSALEMESKASRLDPLSAVNHLELGLVHTFRGEYEQAVLQAEIAIELNEELPNAWWQLFRAHFLAGNVRVAGQIVAEKAHKLGEIYLAEARLMLALQQDDQATARQIVADLDAAPGAIDASLTKRALWYALVGDGESATSVIERAYASADPILISPMHFFLPEDWEQLPEVAAALDKPGLRELFELRRSFIQNGSGRFSQL